MLRFILRRIVFALLLVVCASAGSLLLARLAPGDVTAQLGPFAPAREVALVRERFGLDRSPLSQLGHWFAKALRFDFGESFLYNRPVAPLVGRASINTFAVAAVALLAGTILGLGLGAFTGSTTGPLAAGVRIVSSVLLSTPPLLASLLLVFVAARTGWLPTGGMSSAASTDMSAGEWALDLARHLPLPVLALALPLAAWLERLQSQSMAETLTQPFVTAAAAKGLSRRAIVLRHAWRVSLRPICGVYGIAVGALLSGSFVVEYITAWPGLGLLMHEALRARDVYLAAGCAAAGAALLAMGTLAGDVLLTIVEPRSR